MARITLGRVRGRDGAPGKDGEPGPQGIQGPEGPQGPKGEDGSQPPISDSVTSEDSGVAASSKAVKAAYDAAMEVTNKLPERIQLIEASGLIFANGGLAWTRNVVSVSKVSTGVYDIKLSYTRGYALALAVPVSPGRFCSADNYTAGKIRVTVTDVNTRAAIDTPFCFLVTTRP